MNRFIFKHYWIFVLSFLFLLFFLRTQIETSTRQDKYSTEMQALLNQTRVYMYIVFAWSKMSVSRFKSTEFKFQRSEIKTIVIISQSTDLPGVTNVHLDVIHNKYPAIIT